MSRGASHAPWLDKIIRTLFLLHIRVHKNPISDRLPAVVYTARRQRIQVKDSSILDSTPERMAGRPIKSFGNDKLYSLLSISRASIEDGLISYTPINPLRFFLRVFCVPLLFCGIGAQQKWSHALRVFVMGLRSGCPPSH